MKNHIKIMASSTFLRSLIALLILGILVENCAGWRRIRIRVRRIWRPVCKVTSGALCTAAGTAVGGGVGGAVVATGCSAYAKDKCRRRRRETPSTEDDAIGELVSFPQSFEDYTSGETIDFKSFVAGVENGMPLPLHHYEAVGEAFDLADLNDDAVLDREEFALGSWIIDEGDEASDDLRRSFDNEESMDF